MLPFLYRQKRPSTYLRSYIACYWRFRRNFKSNKTQTIFPDGKYELMWVKQGTLLVDGVPAPRLCVGGMSAAPIKISAPGTVEIWSVRFSPWGLAPFGAAPTTQQPLTPAADVFRPDVTAKLTALFERATTRTLFSDLDNFLLQIVLKSRIEPSALTAATQYLETSRGNVKIRELADYCQLSSRQLERVIARATGKTPREVAARLRFEHIRNSLWLNPEHSIASLAQEFGYADQSHLHKDFKRYTRLTPAQYVEQINKTYGHLRSGYARLARNR